MKLTEHEVAVLASLRFSTIRPVRPRGMIDMAYSSKNGPVPLHLLSSLMKRRLITSVITDSNVFYRLTEFGRALLITLPQTGVDYVKLQAESSS